METLANSILVGPMQLCHGFADDRHGRGFHAIAIIKTASACDRDVQGCEMIWSHVVHYRQGAAVAGSLILPFWKYRAREASAYGRIGSYAHGCHAGRILHLLNGRTVKLLAASLFVVQRTKIEIHGQKI